MHNSMISKLRREI